MATEERSHFANFEFDGRWWLPETPNRQIYGTLRYSQDTGISIDLTDRLKDSDLKPGPVTMESLQREFPIVLGQTDKLEPCTALHTVETSGSVLPWVEGRSRLRARRIYVGGHFASEAEVLFSEQSVEFTYLEDWIGINPFRFDPGKRFIEIPDGPKEIVNVRIEQQQADIAVYLGGSLSYGTQGFAGTRVGSVRIKPDNSRSYSWYEDMVRRIGNLLTLCVGEPVFPRRIKAQPAAAIPSAPREAGARPRDIKVFLHLFEGKEKADLSPVNMPIPFFMVQDRMALLISSWFSIHEEIEPVIGLLLSTYYNSHMYVETEFMTLVQAVEIFHRRVVGGNYLSSEEWQPFYETISRAIPPEIGSDHKAALRNRLKYGNEYSLRKRLGNLLQGLGEDAKNYVTKDFGNFAEECANARNALVHEGGEAVGKSLKELWTMNRRLRALVNILVWRRLGLEDRFTVDLYRRFE